MNRPVPHCGSAETLLASLLYLMNSYQRRPCRCLASCIAQHCQHLSAHPGTSRIVRQVVTTMASQWQAIALAPAPSRLRH